MPRIYCCLGNKHFDNLFLLKPEDTTAQKNERQIDASIDGRVHSLNPCGPLSYTHDAIWQS
ncbi:Uncharacterized protein APZ42_008241 [Daphnia magna]|uniref:Uncharacterized protein n=1 Tax=Daphnia magna TaxID=35525 RepID=A0A164ESL7_9CRUS|nr:Uncharacterized protein APZ42_008241 [Daphnia magna]